ncbi:MAG: alpha/beta hydrolase [Rhizobiaceae bacterium]
MRIVGWIVVVVALAVVLAWFFGPRVPIDTTVTFDAGQIPADIDGWLAGREAAVPAIKDELKKEIVWVDPASKAKTPLAIVYVHGFSASKAEVRPLPDKVAAALGANLFYTRLTGHGQDGAAMGAATVNAWINDFAEALAIGRRLGERVIVIATSSGGSVASWAMTEPGLADNVAGLVLISPNYGVQGSGAFLLTMPFGGLIAELLIGKERSFEPVNEAHARYWTHAYPTAALLPMAGIVKLAVGAPVEQAKVPALFVFSDGDKVVRPDLTRAIAARWGAPHEIVAVTDSTDPSDHVIAGDALSPNTTDPLAAKIVAWVQALQP